MLKIFRILADKISGANRPVGPVLGVKPLGPPPPMPPPSDEVLKIEIEFFEQHRKEWYDYHAGKIALVKGAAIHGFFDDYGNALSAGYDKFGVVSFLIKEVQLKDEVVFIPTRYLYSGRGKPAPIELEEGDIDDGLEQGTQEGNGAGSGSGDCCDSKKGE
ncbi:hypothetical protein LCGC14_0426700 [marine sediment metagenome]|uniref:DUF5678 domain-containing protein n=1 Tax=marine sediment metagenome TaxID=412755 RepID=A0A0F9SVL4_9ZZZZ